MERKKHGYKCIERWFVKRNRTDVFINPVLFLCVIILFSYTQPVFAVTWTNGDIVTPSATSWHFPDVDADSSGNLYAVYRPGTSSGYYLRSWNGISWQDVPNGSFQKSDIPGSIYSINDDLSLAIDSNNKFHIAFRAAESYGGDQPYTNMRQVWHAYFDGTNWSFSLVDEYTDSSGWKNPDDPCINVDSSNNPHITYLYKDTRSSPRMTALKYAVKNGSSWTKTTIDTFSGSADGIAGTRTVLDSSNKAHVSYVKDGSSNEELFYSTNSSGSFVNTRLISEQTDINYYGSCCPALDSEEKVHIAYYEFNENTYVGKLKYTTNAGGSWAHSTVDEAADQDYGVAAVLSINSSNNKAIAYFDYNTGDVRIATQIGSGAWTKDKAYSDDYSYVELNIEINDANKVMAVGDRQNAASNFRAMYYFGSIGPSNSPPTLSNLTGSVSYNENTINAAPAIIDSAVTFTDSDSANLDTGTLTITGVRSTETISVSNQAHGAGNIQRSGNNIQVSDGSVWTTFGTVDGTDTGIGTDFKITFNSASTPTIVDALIQRLNYQSSSQSGESAHDLALTVTDGDGGSTGGKTISVTVNAENDTPTDISLSNASIQENAGNAVVGDLSTADPDN